MHSSAQICAAALTADQIEPGRHQRAEVSAYRPLPHRRRAQRARRPVHPPRRRRPLHAGRRRQAGNHRPGHRHRDLSVRATPTSVRAREWCGLQRFGVRIRQSPGGAALARRRCGRVQRRSVRGRSPCMSRFCVRHCRHRRRSGCGTSPGWWVLQPWLRRRRWDSADRATFGYGLALGSGSRSSEHVAGRFSQHPGSLRSRTRRTRYG